MLNVALFADIKPSVLSEMLQNHDPFRRKTALKHSFHSNCIHSSNVPESVKLNKPSEIPHCQ